MNGALRVLRQEVRRQLPLLLAMGVVTAVLIWAHPSDWGTRWNSLGATLREAVIVIGPACVVVGVWCGGRVRRAAMGELLASTRRSALGRVSVDLVALVVVLYLGVLLGWASAAWTIVVVGGYGTWVAVWFVLGLLPVVAAYTAVGYAVGRLVPWRTAAPVAGLATYVGFGFGVYSDGRIEHALGSGSLGGVNGFALLGGILIAASLGLLGIAVAALALAGAERRPARGLVWAAVSVLALAAATPAFGSSVAQYRPTGVAYQASPPTTCTSDDGPQVCVLREQGHLLGTATRDARTIIDRFGGVPGTPARAGPDSVERLDAGTLPVTPTGITPWGRAGGGNYDRHVVNSYGYLDPWGYCLEARRDDGKNALEQAAQASGLDIAASWLSGAIYQVDDASPLVDRRFAAADRAQRQQFVGRFAQGAQACDADAFRAAADVLPPLPTS